MFKALARKMKPESSLGAAKDNKRPLFLSLSPQEQILFAKRLAIMIKAGVPILGALKMFSRQTISKHTLYVMDQLAVSVENGVSLSAAMRRLNNIFSDFAINIVHIGEMSGTLWENLNYLAEELKKKQELRGKIISALIYPIFIVFATIGVVVLLTVYVFPKIMPIFNSFKFQLPWTTRVLIFVSTLFIRFGLYIFFGIFLAGVIFFVLVKNRRVKLWLHSTIIRVPFIGRLLQSYYIANSTRTLGLLLKSDVHMVQALTIVAETVGNTAYSQAFFSIVHNTNKGGKISEYMERNTKMFPSMLSQMVSVGETTGSLSHSLLYLSEIYEDEMNALTKNLSTSIEPILMICMGLLVGFIALSIITPIYGITQNIHP